jgi:hypothetical protein
MVCFAFSLNKTNKKINKIMSQKMQEFLPFKQNLIRYSHPIRKRIINDKNCKTTNDSNTESDSLQSILDTMFPIK